MYASVLPLPVLAWMMASRPESTTSIASACTGVGDTYPSAAARSTSHGGSAPPNALGGEPSKARERRVMSKYIVGAGARRGAPLYSACNLL